MKRRRSHRRLPDHREPNQPFSARMSGGPHEIWSYGEQAYPILRQHLLLRERLRPYLHQLAESAHRTGAPPMRPLFFDFPDDETAWDVDDQFMLGPDLLVAPITEAGARERTVHLPHGAHWTDTATGAEHEGGKTLSVAAPLERIPVLYARVHASPGRASTDEPRRTPRRRREGGGARGEPEKRWPRGLGAAYVRLHG